MKTTHLALLSLALLFTGVFAPGAASAEDRPRSERRSADRSHHASAHKQTAPHRTDQPNRDRPAPGTASPPSNQHLIRPGGSALGMPPGYYRQNLSQDPPRHHRRGRHGDDHRHGHGHAPVYAPTYVVVPPLFPHDAYSEPLAIGPTRGPEDAVEPLDLEAGTVYGTEPVRQPSSQAPRQAPRQRVQEYAPEPLVTQVPPTPPTHHPTAPPEPEPKDPQPIRLDIVPADADVWLDDEYLGKAGELTASVVLSPGVYLLEVEHDELPHQRLFFGVVDQPLDVRVDLRAEEPRRRYRVR